MAAEEEDFEFNLHINYKKEHGWAPVVRSQRNAHACGYFASLPAIEIMHYNSTGEKLTLSAQELLDRHHSLFGDNLTRSFQIERRSPNAQQFFRLFEAYPHISTEENYPEEKDDDGKYSSVTPYKRNHVVQRPYAVVHLWRTIENNNDSVEEMIRVLRTGQYLLSHLTDPPPNFGEDDPNEIFNENFIRPPNDPTRVPGDHSVDIVGYGRKAGIPYWVIQSSYGTEWANGGFLRMSRGINLLDVEDSVYYPLPVQDEKNVPAIKEKQVAKRKRKRDRKRKRERAARRN